MEQGNTKPDVCIYSIVIDALCKDRNLDAAISILNEMKQKGIPPDIVPYSSLIDGLCKLGEKSFNLSLHLNVTASGGYVEEIGLEDIATYRKDLETLGHFLLRKNRVDLGLHNVLSLEIRDCSFGDKAGGQCCKAGDDTLSLDVFVVSTLWRVFAASSEVAKG
ncbi:hypothetical protein T459_15872 [Capsicum annuum]|uniref:Pentatricopeptide repeat-containing protein n=1 Tax=Capsicum annuum TaxID=4072 RepID=A0A2G2Z735_CAPAN|nr:hypothetical protein T459_15872 [Capsicum annuum]